MKKITLLSCLLVMLSMSIIAQAQKATPLLKNRLYKETIAANTTKAYQVELAKDQYFFAMVMQIGIDLKIETFAPDGKKLKEFDSPNGLHGSEYFTIESATAGTYKIEVKPLEEDSEAGEFTLEVLKIGPKATTKEAKVNQLFAAWDNDHSPGASVAIVKDGEIIYKKGYGLANLEYDIPNTSQTIFHIASISKQFTTFAMAQLADKGKLSLDDDIRKYLPEVPDFGETITIRHLAHHTSGMRDQWNLLTMAGWRMDDVITTEHVLKLVANQKELNYEPGEEYLYCNTGFTLMGEIVARVSEQTFAEYCAENIFQPLEMTNTLFYDDHEKIVKNRAYSYGTNKGGYKKSVLSYANAGATSLFTTVEDLSKWAMNFENIKVGNEAIMKAMHTKGILNNKEEINYALGQSINKYKGLNRVSHGGADAGYRTYLARFPDQQFSVVVFSNLGSFNTGSIALQIADIYLVEAIAAAKSKEEKEEKIEQPQVVSEKKEAITVDDSTLQSYHGDYELQPGFIITIKSAEGQLTAQATGQSEFNLTANAINEFEHKAFGVHITFDKNEKEEIHQLTLKQGGGEFKAPKLAAFDAESIDLTTFEGKYYSEELSTFYTFLVEDGQLLARHSRHPDLHLKPVKADFLAGDAWFFGQVEMVRNEAGEISGCKVSSGRVRNVWFEKE